MLWKSKGDKAPHESGTSRRPEAATAKGDTDGREFDGALDAVASMLRQFGKFAFDLPDTNAQETASTCDQWAQHLLVRSPRPGGQDGEAKGTSARDWVGASHFFSTLRRTESVHVTKTLNDLRHAIWAFVYGLNQTLTEDSESDTHVKQQLTRLKEATKSGSTEQLKREALAVAVAIGTAMEDRKQKQRTYSAELGARVAALGRQLEEARRDGAIDALTQLQNRKAFDEQIEKAAALHSLVEQPVCLVLVDIDHFKKVNDTYGHQMGDEVLRKMAECLVRTFLRRDDFVGRYGGEEFAVLLRDTRLKDALMVSERLLKATRALSFSSAEATFAITASAGVAELQAGEPVHEWILRADRALYSAKNGGRDQVREALTCIESSSSLRVVALPKG